MGAPSGPDVDRSISAERALLLLFLLAGPIVLVEWVIFAIVRGRAALWDGLDVVLTLHSGVLLFIVGLLTHEFVHGLTWKLVGRLPWRHIRFGFQLKTFTPFVHVTTPLGARAYRWGTVMALLAVGLLPFLSVWSSTSQFGLRSGWSSHLWLEGTSLFSGHCVACQGVRWCETTLSASDATSPHNNNNGLHPTPLRSLRGAGEALAVRRFQADIIIGRAKWQD
jgi:hypothetical protein